MKIEIMKSRKKKIKVIVEKTNTGFSAFGNDQSVFTSGGSIPELMANALEAFNLFFEEEGEILTMEDLKFEIDFQQFFQYYRVINAKFLAKKIGMNVIQECPKEAYAVVDLRLRMLGKAETEQEAVVVGLLPASAISATNAQAK